MNLNSRTDSIMLTIKPNWLQVWYYGRRAKFIGQYFNWPWPTLSIYYTLAIFICLHKAFHGRLPVTLIDLISKKRATNYSTRTCASLIVPRFNTGYMKDSVAFRGSVLWNAVTNNCGALTKNIPYRDLRLKLKSQANFNEFSFKITSAATCNFILYILKFMFIIFLFVSANLVQTFFLYKPLVFSLV